MTRRFFSEVPRTPGAVVLCDDESRHLATVLRARAGDVVELFDGEGRVAAARVARVDRRAATLEIEAPPIETPRPRPLELFCALPRAGGADDVVRLATEVGATSVTPLLCERGVFDPAARERKGRGDRFRAAAIAALKQCRRAWLPTFGAPLKVDAFEASPEREAIVGSPRPSAARFKDVVARVAAATTAAVVVGPEGGFTEGEEATLLSRGVAPVRIGDGVLRVETAVVVLLSFVGEARR